MACQNSTEQLVKDQYIALQQMVYTNAAQQLVAKGRMVTLKLVDHI